MKSKRIFWITLLAAFLACGTLASCGGDDHQTPPALSGDGDGNGDGGDEGGDEGQDGDGYPAGLTVETFTDELSGGGECLGFYAVVDFKANPKLPHTHVLILTTFDLDEYVYDALAAGASGFLLNTRLSNPGDLAAATGGTVFVGEDELRSFAPASTYTVGNMPWFRRVWLSLADRPFVLVFCALVAAIVAGAGIFLFMRRWIGRRGTN